MTENHKITEDSFLRARVADQRPTSCWLANGTRLQGTIIAFDQEAIFMRPDGADENADTLMIYKLQIASVLPVSAMNAARGRSPYLRDLSAGRTVGER